MWEKPSLNALRQSISDPTNPIGMRMRAAYYLRQEYDTIGIASTSTNTIDDDTDTIITKTSNTSCSIDPVLVLNDDTTKKNDNSKDIVLTSDIEQQEQHKLSVITILANGLLDKRHGRLMRHEFAYVMGQLRDINSCSVLEQIVQDCTDDIIVRHEAAEALGAIGAQRSVPILQNVITNNNNTSNSSNDNNNNTTGVVDLELIETCQIALDVIEWRNRNGTTTNNNNQSTVGDDDTPDTMPIVACACMLSPYSSIDPAPPHPSHNTLSCIEIGTILRNTTIPMFERYRAMFSLRNIGTDDAVHELCTTLISDTSSALLRHEISYILGQLQHPNSVEALEISLRTLSEHSMVRHESAEALGAIDTRWDDVQRILLEFCNDDDDIVRESCLVALDAADYWGYSTTTTTTTTTATKEEEEEETTTQQQQQEYNDKNDEVGKSSSVTFANQKSSTRILSNHHFNVQQ